MKSPQADRSHSSNVQRADKRKAPIMGRGNIEQKAAKFKRTASRQSSVQTKRMPTPNRLASKSRSPKPAKPASRTALKAISRWFDDTRLALESPLPNTLERLGARGNWQNALGYVTASATLTALMAFRTGWKGMLALWLLTLLSYAMFVVVSYLAAAQQGGEGKLEALAYATALYWAPLAPFTALLPFLLGGAWIPAAALIQIFITVFYAFRVLNGTIWLSFSGQWNALTAGIAASSAAVLLAAFTVCSSLLHG